MKRSIIAPIVLILLGIVFLLNNVGILSWDIWLSLWKFWPALLILIGVELFTGRAASIKTLIILFALIFIVPILITFTPLAKAPLISESIDIEESLGTATSGKIAIDLPSTNLNIAPLATESARFVEGKISYSQAGAKPIFSKSEENSAIILNISQSNEKQLPIVGNVKNNTSLLLTKRLPLEIKIKTTAATANLDLSSLSVKYFEFESGASSLTVKFNKDTSTQGVISTGASTINIEIPDGLEAKLLLEPKVGNITIDERRFSKEGEVYKTKQFDSASTKLELEVKSTAGTINVK